MTEQQNNLPNDQPIERDTFDRGDPARRCTAHRKNGDRCRKWAIRGGTVCISHGGAAKHVRNAARVRLQNAADRMARELLRMAVDDNVSDSVKLAAIKDALDRAGLNSKTEIELSARPWEQIEESVIAQLSIGGSRAEFRRSQGIEDNSDEADPLSQLYANDVRQAMREETTRNPSPVLDVLVVDVNDTTRQPCPDGRGDGGRPASERTPGETNPSRPGGLTLVEAAEQVQHLNDYNAQRRGDERRAKVHQVQRALPPGRSS